MKSTILHRVFILVLVLSGFFQLSLTADEVTRNQALTIASKVVMQYFPADRQLSSGGITIGPGFQANDPFFICNVGKAGFVLVAKKVNCPPVLGFSWESSFPASVSEISPLLKTVIGSIRNQCNDYDSRDTVSPVILKSWQLLSGLKSGLMTESGAVLPLLATSWNCDSTFFNLFPRSFKNGGSVPIAMGQVFRFYATPDRGVEKLCYLLNGYGDFCNELDKARLRFDRMSNTIGNPAVDSLIYYMAVTCMMQPEGASLSTYASTLPVHFGYSPDMRVVEGWNYNIGELVRHQLSLRRPVLADWIGQSFVIDGWFPDNLYHFNMGLGGLYNGYYLLDYPVVKVATDHALLNCYIDYHPKSILPVPAYVSAAPEGDSIRISWTIALSDANPPLVRCVVLRDGLIPVAQTAKTSVLVSTEKMGGSSSLRVVADFGLNGASELSEPYRYISDRTLADIPSLPLRQSINTKLGNTDLLRQPFVGELDLIRDLEITYPDQRGLEKLTMLKSLRIDGTDIRVLRDGEYLQNLLSLRFYKCIVFDFTIFGRTRSLYQLFGYDFLPFDLYDFRHNSDIGLLQFLSTDTNPNMLMDLYGADKYFPKLADFFLFHMGAGASSTFGNCYVSYESYLDFYPKIKSNLNLLERTKPSSFAPCYPTPVRNDNLLSVSRISWQANFNEQPSVYYNVFIGEKRNSLEPVSIFQSEKYYDGTFEPNKDYYWRVEAYHADSTYYSGIYHFSTWQDLPIPFYEKFDDYYSACPVVDESPFWVNFDNTLTGKAVTSRNTKFDGFYSLDLKPGSDAGVVIKSPVHPVYYIEFRFLNQGGQVAAELLQKSGSSNDNIVNSRIDFQGNDIGLFTFGASSFPFSFVPGEWNRVNFALNMNTGAASFSLNDLILKEWQWHVQIGGSANNNPFKGIRFVNNVGSAGGSGFIDNLIIDLNNPASAEPVLNPGLDMVYLSGSREVILAGIQPSEIRNIAVYDIRGSKLASRENPDSLIFPVGPAVRNGVYLVVVNLKNGLPFSRKIAVME